MIFLVSLVAMVEYFDPHAVIGLKSHLKPAFAETMPWSAEDLLLGSVKGLLCRTMSIIASKNQ
jgi:hypothetical protein